MSLRVGIDLVAVEDVEASLCAHSDRYLQRVYSTRELEECRAGSGAVVLERLAARFAAKEATIKVLRPRADEAVPWKTIEVVRDAVGGVELKLSGSAADLARDAGLASFAVSLTHERSYAAAVVLAEVERTPERVVAERG
ncbi:MAG TPA: holo-ACP synthase [Gaiellaceae bacterium]|nr:holo-ACP synthase [Gaiellaceae bacterium]